MKIGAKIWFLLGFCFMTIGLVAVSETQVRAGTSVSTNKPFNFIPLVLKSVPLSFLNFTNLSVGQSYQEQSIAGWYWTNQPVSFSATNPVYGLVVTGYVLPGTYRLAVPPVPDQSFATAIVSNGMVVGAEITAGGSGYISAPAVNFRSHGGQGAMAIGETDGAAVTNILIISGGSGYTNTPIVEIDPPPANAVLPVVQRVMQMNAAVTAGAGYQLQSATAISGPWSTMNSVSSPTGNYSQFLVVSNQMNFFRILSQ